jgi:uncharacterized membrane protein YoaT (DUF817 family)
MGYPETVDDFIDKWAERWRDLVDLLYETIRTDKPAGVPLKPGIIEENLYQGLRSWFIENEARFLPIWKNYYQSQDWTLDASEDIIQEINDGEKCSENPFIAFYMAENLDSLLHCISGSSERYPTEEQAWDIAMDLLRLDSLALSFVTNFTKEDTEG